MKDARVMRVGAARFALIDGELYERGFSLPLLKYLDPEWAKYVLKKIYERSCGNN